MNGTEPRVLSGATNGFARLAVSPDGRYIAACEPDDQSRIIEVRLWDVPSLFTDHPTSAEPITMPMHEDVEADYCVEVQFSNDSTRIFIAHGRNAASMWGINPRRELWQEGEIIDPGQRFGWTAAAAYDGEALVARSDYHSGRYLSDLIPGHPPPYLSWPDPDEVYSMAFSTTGALLALGTASGDAIVFDVESHQAVHRFHATPAPISSVRFSPDDAYLAAGSVDGSLFTWNLASGQERRTLGAHPNLVTDIRFSPDGLILASAAASDGTIELRQVPSLKLTQLLAGHQFGVAGLAFLPDETHLVSSGADGNVIIWSLSP